MNWQLENKTEALIFHNFPFPSALFGWKLRQITCGQSPTGTHHGGRSGSYQI